MPPPLMNIGEATQWCSECMVKVIRGTKTPVDLLRKAALTNLSGQLKRDE